MELAWRCCVFSVQRTRTMRMMTLPSTKASAAEFVMMKPAVVGHRERHRHRVPRCAPSVGKHLGPLPRSPDGRSVRLSVMGTTRCKKCLVTAILVAPQIRQPLLLLHPVCRIGALTMWPCGPTGPLTLGCSAYPHDLLTWRYWISLYLPTRIVTPPWNTSTLTFFLVGSHLIPSHLTSLTERYSYVSCCLLDFAVFFVVITCRCGQMASAETNVCGVAITQSFLTSFWKRANQDAYPKLQEETESRQ